MSASWRVRVLLVFWICSQVTEIGYAEADAKKKTKAESAEPTFAGEYAFIGTLEVGHDNVTRPLCIVTALKENWVITVFSCLSEILVPGEELTLQVLISAQAKIKLSNFKLDSSDIGEKTVGINKVLIGERFGEDNIVLLRLGAPISTDIVRKVTLDSEQELDPKATCVNVGWKPKVFPGTQAPENKGELQAVAQKVSHLKSGDTGLQDGLVHGQTIQTTKNKDICKFENGSPLLCEEDSKWNLVGVAGYLGDEVTSRECQSPSEHSVYISIEPFVKWIFSQIRETAKPKQ